MSQQFKKRKQGLGFTYGLISGIAFSIVAWGIDCISLANAHVSYARIKFLPGLLFASLVGGLVGWASSKISKGLVTVFLWLFFWFVLSLAYCLAALCQHAFTAESTETRPG